VNNSKKRHGFELENKGADAAAHPEADDALGWLGEGRRRSAALLPGSMETTTRTPFEDAPAPLLLGVQHGRKRRCFSAAHQLLAMMSTTEQRENQPAAMAKEDGEK